MRSFASKVILETLFQSVVHIKISAPSDPIARSYATFPNFQKVELTKLPPKVNFNVPLSKLYLCATSENRCTAKFGNKCTEMMYDVWQFLASTVWSYIWYVIVRKMRTRSAVHYLGGQQPKFCPVCGTVS